MGKLFTQWRLRRAATKRKHAGAAVAQLRGVGHVLLLLLDKEGVSSGPHISEDLRAQVELFRQTLSHWA